MTSPSPNPVRDHVEATIDTNADRNEMNGQARAMMLEADGNVQIELASGQVASLEGLKGGIMYPIRVKRVISGAGTTVTTVHLFA